MIAGYHPENFDMGYDGAVPASRALSRSLNVPAVKMLQQYKYEKFYDFLHKAGITTLTKPLIITDCHYTWRRRKHTLGTKRGLCRYGQGA
jgi:membrane peptidoglycan carboxypeptidase